uniref:CBF1-interacting co-repressor CIR N-terminal domain-containing protein n=1 Tax=Globisporangium ultimum (strain ATCC 200006 / CBS 805.95 / DAOM BR144) TaxID=431595 RepID=K3X5U8_GLOUD
MGGGGLRILGHKRWHVWRHENIERVRRDEREHEEKQQTLCDQQRRIEQERRAQTLTQRVENVRNDETRESVSSQHINFFKQEEEQLAITAGKAKGDSTLHRHGKQRRHPQNGAAQDTLAAQGYLPWYAKAPTDEREDAKDEEWTSRRAPSDRKSQKRERALELEDPLQHMRPRRPSYGDMDEYAADAPSAKRSKDMEERTERVYKSEYSTKVSLRTIKTDELRVGKSNKKKTAKKRKSSSSSKHKKSSQKEDLMAQLRREREEREQRERRRAEHLMKGYT